MSPASSAYRAHLAGLAWAAPLYAGATQFGSGWAWLVVGKDGKLKITKTPNAENPWVHGETPILTVDGEPGQRPATCAAPGCCEVVLGRR